MAPIENQTGKKKKLHIGKYFFYGFLVLLLSCFIFIFISYGQSKKTGTPPNLLGFNVLVVQSASMEPTISPGDVVIVKGHKAGETSEIPQKGDVITFKQILSAGEQPTWITHRVVDVITTGGSLMYTTKGDANEPTDKDPVTESNLLGKVVATVPKMGYFFDFIKQPLGMFVCIGLPILILILFEAINLIRTVRTPEEKLVEEAEERDEESLNDLPRVGARSRRNVNEDIDLSQAGMSPEYAYRPKRPPSQEEESSYLSSESRRIDDETLYYHQDEDNESDGEEYTGEFGAGFIGGYSHVHGGQETGVHSQSVSSPDENAGLDMHNRPTVLSNGGDSASAVPNHINAGKQTGEDKKLSLTLSGDESSEFTVNDINICYEDETLNLQMNPCDEPCQIRVKMKNDQAVLSVETPSKQTRFTVLNKDGRPRKISISSENDQKTGSLPQDSDNT